MVSRTTFFMFPFSPYRTIFPVKVLLDEDFCFSLKLSKRSKMCAPNISEFPGGGGVTSIGRRRGCAISTCEIQSKFNLNFPKTIPQHSWTIQKDTANCTKTSKFLPCK